MPRIASLLAIALVATFSTARGDELKPADILNVKGDGPSGKGNTDGATWGFWFELAHKPGDFNRLSLHTTSLTEDQRKNGVVDNKAKRGKGKVRGPIGGLLPDGESCEGWIFGRDWDGRFEGFWANKKTGAIMASPYVEKTFHGAVAVTYKIGKAGPYAVTGKLTDLQVNNDKPHDGISWRIEKISGNKATLLSKGGPIGDGKGPESDSFTAPQTEFAAGDLVRLVIHPNQWWGQDLTRIDSFKVEPSRAGK